MKLWVASRLRDNWTWRLAALWLGLMVAYMLSAPPDITFEDTSLFAGACATLGLPHPPGYPFYVWSCFPLTSLFGALGWSQALGAAMWSAFTVASACVVLAMLIRRFKGTPEVALFAAGLLGLAPAVWDQAQIPEVYGLNLLLLVTCWYLCQRFVEDGRGYWLYALAFCTGLGLATHWPLFVLSYPFLLLWLAQSWPRLLVLARDKRVVGCCLASLAVGLLPYAHLLLVSDEAFMFDQDYHRDKMLAYVSREIYGVGGTYLPWLPRIAQATATSFMFITEYFFLFGLAVPIGWYMMWKRRARWQLAAVACGMLMTTFVLSLIRPYDPYSAIGLWIFHVYPLPAYAVATLPLALGLDHVLSKTRWGQGNVVIAAVALLGVAFWTFPQVDRSGDDIAAKYSRLILQRVPQGAVVLNTTSDFGFPLRYVSYFDDSRSDFEIIKEEVFLGNIDGGFLSADGEKKLLAEQRPVVFLNKLEFDELGMRYHGTHFLLDKDLDPGTISVDIDDETRAFLAQLYELRQKGVRNAFTTQFALNVITNHVVVLETARLQGAQLDLEDLSLLQLLEDTPEGQFAKFLAFVLGNPQTPSVTEIESKSAVMLPYWDGLHAQQRSDFLHLIATARLFDGNFSGGLDILQAAFNAYPRAENKRVLIDLLQVIATQGDYEEYERLRKRYPTLKSNTALATYDAKCKEVLLRDCTVSLQ